MSSRPGIQLTVTAPADGGVSPNKYESKISVHVRAYWPPLATRTQVLDAIDSAYVQALDEFENKWSK